MCKTWLFLDRSHVSVRKRGFSLQAGEERAIEPNQKSDNTSSKRCHDGLRAPLFFSSSRAKRGWLDSHKRRRPLLASLVHLPNVSGEPRGGAGAATKGGGRERKCGGGGGEIIMIDLPCGKKLSSRPITSRPYKP